jgi:hypothetical protein
VAAVLLLVAPDVRLPSWIGWVAVVLALFAGWTAFGQWGALMDVGEDQIELGLEDYLPFLVYIAGILLVLGGAVLTAVQATPAASAALAGVLGSDAQDAVAEDAGSATFGGAPSPAVAETPVVAAPAVDIATALSAEPPATDPPSGSPGVADPAARRRSRLRRRAPSAGRAAISFGDDLGEDREGGLGRRPAAEVEPDRSAQRACSSPSRGVSRPDGRRLARPHRADGGAAALPDRRLVELDVVREDDHRVIGARPISSVPRRAAPRVDRRRETFGRREGRAAIGDDRLDPKPVRAGPATVRLRPPRRPRTRRTGNLDERRPTPSSTMHEPGRALSQPHELRVRSRARAIQPTSSWTTSSPAAPPRPVCWPNAAGGESRGGVMTAAPVPAPATPRRLDRRRRDRSTRTSIVPPQASPTSHACSSLIP